MKNSPFDIRFLDYIDGTMSSEDQEKFLRDLAEDPTLLRAFEEYQHMISLEAKLRKELSPSPALLTRIMAEVDDKPHVVPVWSSCMAWISKKQIAGGFATAVMVCLCVMIVEDWPGGEGGQQYLGVPVVPAPMVGVREVPADVGGVDVPGGDESHAEVARGPVAVEPVGVMRGAAVGQPQEAGLGGNGAVASGDREKESRMMAFGDLVESKKADPLKMNKEEFDQYVREMAGSPRNNASSDKVDRQIRDMFQKILREKGVSAEVIEAKELDKKEPKQAELAPQTVPPANVGQLATSNSVNLGLNEIPGKNAGVNMQLMSTSEGSRGLSSKVLASGQGSDDFWVYDTNGSAHKVPLTSAIGNAVTEFNFGQPAAGQILETSVHYAQSEAVLCQQTHIQFLSDLANGPGGDAEAQAYLGCIRKNNNINSAQLDGQTKGPLCQAITVCQNDHPLKHQLPDIHENQRILTQTEPMSTFSIDVDTGSYTMTRNLINHGTLPEPTAVRIEEMVNYFDYTYPNIDRKPFGVSYEIAPSPFNEGRHLLRIGVATTPTARAKSWNLVFLVDVSGSMADAMKLDLIKRSLRGLVDKLKAGDTVAIVTYAGDARVALQPTSLSELDKILIAIDSLSAGGGTNGADGILTAYQLAHSHMKEGSVNRVILATDGDFNIGITSDTELLRMIEKERESGVTLTTIGVGSGNYLESKMEQLADKGNGNYFYLDSDKEARRVFDERLMSTVEVVAKDVKLQIEFNPAHVMEYRLVGYDNRILKNVDFKNDKVDAGELGSGHTVTAVYEVTLKNSPVVSQLKSEYRYQETPKPEVTPVAVLPDEFAFLKIRFKQPDGATSEELQFPLLARDIRDSFGQGSKDFQFTTAVLGFGSLLRASHFRGSARFEQIIEIAQANIGADLDGERREFVELVKSAGTIKGNLR